MRVMSIEHGPLQPLGAFSQRFHFVCTQIGVTQFNIEQAMNVRQVLHHKRPDEETHSFKNGHFRHSGYGSPSMVEIKHCFTGLFIAQDVADHLPVEDDGLDDDALRMTK